MLRQPGLRSALDALESTMNDPVAETLEELKRRTDPFADERGDVSSRLQWLNSATGAQITRLLAGLADGIQSGAIPHHRLPYVRQTLMRITGLDPLDDSDRAAFAARNTRANLHGKPPLPHPAPDVFPKCAGGLALFEDHWIDSLKTGQREGSRIRSSRLRRASSTAGPLR